MFFLQTYGFKNNYEEGGYESRSAEDHRDNRRRDNMVVYKTLNYLILHGMRCCGSGSVSVS